MTTRVIDVLRRFLPIFLGRRPPLHEAQRRAIWAINHCRTAVMGGHLYACSECGDQQFAYHSCNHRSCPQCGRAANAEWVARELDKQIAVPYFMVTFTLPAELRPLFFNANAKEAFDLFYAASSATLRSTLASPRWLGAQTNGFTGVLHTWNQRLLPHPHIHYIVPGGGLNSEGDLVRVKNPNFLLPLAVLSKVFREQFWELIQTSKVDWKIDPTVWSKNWGVHIQAFGSGQNAIKYLGAYVSRSVIGDGRIVKIEGDQVTFRWKDRSQGDRIQEDTISGVEFVRRYLRHVLPRGLRSIRYFGFCHPAAKATRERIAFLSGKPLHIGKFPKMTVPQPSGPLCKCCDTPMRAVQHFLPSYHPRPPPQPQAAA